MARKPRRALGGELHLVVQQVRSERVPLFRNNWSYQTYLEKLALLMPSH